MMLHGPGQGKQGGSLWQLQSDAGPGIAAGPLVPALSQFELVVVVGCLRCDDWVVKRKTNESALL